MKQTIQRRVKRISVLLLALMLMVGSMVVPSSAGVLPITRTYIQATIDPASWEILAGVVEWEAGVGGNQAEAKRIGETLLKTLAGSSQPKDVSSKVSAAQKMEGSACVNNLVLCFPGKMSFSGWNDNSTAADTSRASLIRNSLIYDLNGAFKFVYGDPWKPTASTLDEQIQEYSDRMKDLIAATPGGTVNGFSISLASSNDMNGIQFPDLVTDNTDYVKITKISSGETRIFQYRMAKGYVDVGRGINPKELGLSKIDSSDDASYIHWGTLAVEAFVNYGSDEKLQVTANDVYSGKVGSIEKAIADLLGGFASWVANALGLWNFDEIIFNAGIRGTSTYVGGVFPTSWQPIIWGFFFVSEVVALGILLFAIIYNVGKKVMSTIDPVARASAIEQIKYLFIVALILGLLPLAIPIFLNLAKELTGFFHDILGGKTAEEKFSGFAASGGGLGSVLTYLLYLGALVYFNVFYVFRSLSVAMLIMLAPIFVALMAINENKRYMTVTWFKEFCSQLFIQPVQAFMLCVILLVPPSGRRIETIIMAYVMIPLTNSLRQLFFGNAGSMADMVGQKGQQSAKRTAMTIAGAGLSAIRGAAGAIGASREGQSKEGSESEGSGNGASGSSTGASNTSLTRSGSGSAGGASSGESSGGGTAAGGTSSGDAKGKTTPESSAERVSPGASVSKPSELSSQAKEGMDAGAEAGGSSDAPSAPVGGPSSTGGTADSGSSSGGSSIGTKVGGAAMIAGAAALGALGGVNDYMGKRLFGIPPGRNGGLVTQLSRTAGAAGGRMMRGSSSNAGGGQGASSGGSSSIPQPINRQAKFNDTAGGNAYARGMTDHRVENGANKYTINPDDMKKAGINGIHGAGKDQSVVGYSMENLGADDQARLNQMVDMWQNGSAEEKAAMQAAGISDVTPVTRMKDGQEQVTGVDVTYNKDLAKQNFGIDTAPARTGGKGFEMSVGGDQAPAMVPDMANYMNTPQASAAAATSMFSKEGGTASIDGDTVKFYAPSEAAMSDMQGKMTEDQRNLINNYSKPIEGGGVEAQIPQAEFTKAFSIPSSQATSQMRDEATQANVPFTQIDPLTPSPAQFQQSHNGETTFFTASSERMSMMQGDFTEAQQALISKYGETMTDGSFRAAILQAEFKQAFPDIATQPIITPVSIGGNGTVIQPPASTPAPVPTASPIPQPTPASNAPAPQPKQPVYQQEIVPPQPTVTGTGPEIEMDISAPPVQPEPNHPAKRPVPELPPQPSQAASSFGTAGLTAEDIILMDNQNSPDMDGNDS